MQPHNVTPFSSLNTLEHINMHHANADGWVTLAKKQDGRWQQWHYRPDELAQALSKWLGEDVYFSQNTFYIPQRRIDTIRQLRALYVDLDCYLLGYAPEWLLGALELDFFRQSMPEPNLVIFSGRGLVLVWFIEPVPYQALPLWAALQKHFGQALQRLGADMKSSDPTRVFRVAGSINSKSGQTVMVQYRHNYRYKLRDLQYEWLPELPQTDAKKKKGRPSKLARLFNAYSLHAARLADLVKLLELRSWDVKGQREVMLFLYRYWTCCFLGDTEEALRQTLELNSQFKEPLSENEVVKATKSAEKAWQAKNDKQANEIAKAKGYPGAGYNISNKKIIEWLQISLEEQRFLKTIIGPEEKRHRDRVATQEARREAGIIPRAQYLMQAQERRQKAVELRKKHFTQAEIAEQLGCSERWVKHISKHYQ